MSDRDKASTLGKGLAVLECFEEGRANLTMAEVARLTGFDRATARRLCLTLEESGFLTKQDRAYSLTPKVVAIAGGYLTSKNIGRSVQPILNQFAEILEGEIAMAVRHRDRAVYIARSSVSAARLSFGFSVGSTLPLLSTAVGRMLLAHSPETKWDAELATLPHEKYTDNTDMDLASIREKIRSAREEGYAYSVGEFERGAAGIAVPVYNDRERPAVLATSATVNQFAQEGELDRVLDILRRAAMNLSR